MKNRELGVRGFLSLAIAGILVFSMGCSSELSDTNEISDKNYVEAGDPNIEKTIGDSDNQFNVIGINKYKEYILSGHIKESFSTSAQEELKSLSSSSLGVSHVHKIGPSLQENSLLFEMPIKMIGTPMIFGSVITQVSDQKKEDLGNLKLADLPSFQVKPMIHQRSANSYSVVLINCGADCSSSSSTHAILQIPIVGLDSFRKALVLDLASLGDELDLSAIRKGDPTLESFKSKSSRAVRFDYSRSTLVFDVEAHLIDKNASETDPNVPETVITNRWYLKPGYWLNPAFVTRTATPGVGFFMTERSIEPLIQRWDFDKRRSEEGIRYYIKHVPQEYRAAFASAFDAWNLKLRPIIGKKVFNYTFIEEDDPVNRLLVTGDVRYNILEWDLVNKANYGGLGPSIAHQYTGEVFQASVLVQGPTIVGIYTKWFKANEKANELRFAGNHELAEKFLSKTHQEISNQLERYSGRKFQIKLGNQLQMKIRSQQPSLEDPIMSKEEFDPTPPGIHYQDYMNGYFHDMIAHELGHNLELRHNFKGNLGATNEANQNGGVSRSIMEYLGRKYRYLDEIGEYDLMAISYGYQGIPPHHTDWYCTDEDSADLDDPTKSAECSSNDATNDPFSYYESRLKRVTDLLIAPEKSTPPEWSMNELKSQLKESLVGLGAYAVSAEQTANTWTNFFKGVDRPAAVSDVKLYVLHKIKATVCDPRLDQEIDHKNTAEGKEKVRNNLSEFRGFSTDLLKSVFTPSQLSCSSLQLF